MWFLCDFILFLGVVSLRFHFISRCGFFAISFHFWRGFHCDFISFLGVVSLRFHFYISSHFNLIDYLIIFMASNCLYQTITLMHLSNYGLKLNYIYN
jgi:hypothetical protein